MKIDWTKVKEGLNYQDVLKEENKELKEENTRLNNIIRELEKDSEAFKKLSAWVINRHEPDLFHKMEIINKLQELKGSE